MEWVAAAIVLALFFIYPKKMFIFLGVMVGLLALGGLGFYVYSWLDEKAKNSVTISVEYNSVQCSEEFPLLIVIENSSDRVVSKIEWDIGVFKKGHSTDLSSSGFRQYSSDKILSPSESLKLCYSNPNLKKTSLNLSVFEYRIKNKSVRFSKDA